MCSYNFWRMKAVITIDYAINWFGERKLRSQSAFQIGIGIAQSTSGSRFQVIQMMMAVAARNKKVTKKLAKVKVPVRARCPISNRANVMNVSRKKP